MLDLAFMMGITSFEAVEIIDPDASIAVSRVYTGREGHGHKDGQVQKVDWLWS